MTATLWRRKHGYVASYVGAVLPIAASTVLIIPLAAYVRAHSAQLELGGLFFVLITLAAAAGGILLAPLGIYLVLKQRGYKDAGRTVKCVIVLAVGLALAATAVGLVLEAFFSRTVANDISSVGFVIGLALLPGASRWYVLRPGKAGTKQDVIAPQPGS